MNTLICAGGSGARVLEAVLHLCAAGLGPKDLGILMVDPDQSNGNGTRVNSLVANYLELHDAVAGRLGAGLNLFDTRLDLLDKDPQRQEIKYWNPVTSTERKLSGLLNAENLTGCEPAVTRLFFTEKELDMELDQGFCGHTAIGAAAMSLVSMQADAEPWKTLAEKLLLDIAQPHGSNVFLVGSVFGGTGASAIHPLVRFLREIPQGNHSRLKIGVGALVPYFSFTPSTAKINKVSVDMAAKAEWFPMATRAAAEFYEHLRENNDWPFDAMYWIGDNGPQELVYRQGGPGQENPAHFVDLLAAIACLEFFHDPVANKACHYAGPTRDEIPELKDLNLLGWHDLPLRVFNRRDLEQKLLRMTLVGAAHLGFFRELLSGNTAEIHRRPFLVPWYRDRFEVRGDMLSVPTNQDTLDQITKFFANFHFPWWKQIHGEAKDKDRTRLFNRASLPFEAGGTLRMDLNRFSHLLWGNGADDMDSFDRFFSDTVSIPSNQGGNSGGAAYLAQLALAADRFIGREYLAKAAQEAY